jgi:hypothetical protein
MVTRRLADLAMTGRNLGRTATDRRGWSVDIKGP